MSARYQNSQKSGQMEQEELPESQNTPAKATSNPKFGFINEEKEMSSKSKKEQIFINGRSQQLKKKVSTKREIFIIDETLLKKKKINELINHFQSEEYSKKHSEVPKELMMKDVEELEEEEYVQDLIDEYEDTKNLEEMSLITLIEEKKREEEQLEKELDELTQDFGKFCLN